MVSLTVTGSRVAAVLRDAADRLQQGGWDPERRSVCAAIDEAAGYVRPGIDQAAEDTTLRAWEALGQHIGGAGQVLVWERAPGRTQPEVLAALRAAAEEVSGRG